MRGVHASFVDTLGARRNEVARRAAERIVQELPSYRSLGEQAVQIIATVVGDAFETLVARWSADDRLPPESLGTEVRPAAGIDLGIPLTDRLSAHRIAGEVIWDTVQDVATELSDLDTDFVLWVTSVAFDKLNALAAAVTEQHLEVEQHHQRWRRELESTFVGAALASPADLDLARSTIRALGIDAGMTWQVVVVLQGSDAGVPLSRIGSLGSWAEHPDRTVLTSQHGRETRVLVTGRPVEPSEVDVVGSAAVGVGRPRRRLEELTASHQRAHDAAVVAERRGGGALGVDCTRLERFLEGRVAPDDLAEDLLAPLGGLPVEQSELLAESLEAYLDGQCSVTAAARALNLHPQSFRYRLGKLESIFGDDLHDPRRRLLLHVAITRYRQDRRAHVGDAPRDMADATG